ncbi:MAG TPA: methyltransferase domain-containing protein, partial [Solirubrobacterales bacterium]
MRPRHLLGAAAAATLAAALWWRKNPSACPYGQRFWVEAPHPIITRDRLRSVLRPLPGERLLEVGVGTGYYSHDLAEWVGPEGKLELFDLQQEFLDHVMRGAAERGLANLVPTQGDATALPYEDASVDAVILTAVLGEIPDSAAALRE